MLRRGNKVCKNGTVTRCWPWTAAILSCQISESLCKSLTKVGKSRFSGSPCVYPVGYAKRFCLLCLSLLERYGTWAENGIRAHGCAGKYCPRWKNLCFLIVGCMFGNDPDYLWKRNFLLWCACSKNTNVVSANSGVLVTLLDGTVVRPIKLILAPVRRLKRLSPQSARGEIKHVCACFDSFPQKRNKRVACMIHEISLFVISICLGRCVPSFLLEKIQVSFFCLI